MKETQNHGFSRNAAALLVLAVLLGCAAANVWFARAAICDDVMDLEPEPVRDIASLTAYRDAADEILRENIAGGRLWGELYGKAVRLLGKNEIDGFTCVRDRSGVLHQANFWNTTDVDMKDAAQRIRRLQDLYSEPPAAEEPPSGHNRDIYAERTSNVIVLLYPSKYDPAWTDGFYGIPYQDLNPLADELLRYLRRYNVDCIDYRELLRESGAAETGIFYRGDPYWNVETAFWATDRLVDHIRGTYGDDWDPERAYCDLENYEVERYRNFFFGEQALDAGGGYSEPDDYTLILPDFHADIHCSFRLLSGDTAAGSGSVRSALISERYVSEEDIYEREMHRTYLSDRYTKGQIINLDAGTDAPSLLFIWDSYSPEMPVFLASMASRIDLIDTLNLKSGTRVETLLGEEPYDYIIVALSVDHLSEKAFPFCIERAADAEENLREAAP